MAKFFGRTSYIIISLLFPILFSKNIKVRLIGYLLVFGLSLAFPAWAFASSWLPMFMIGIIYISNRYKTAGIVEFWVILLISIGVTQYILNDVAYLIAGLSTLAIIHFFPLVQSKVGNFLGDISYSIYLVHMMFPLGMINFLAPRVHIFGLRLLVLLFAFVSSIIFAYIFYLVIEKPSKKYASNISLKYRHKNTLEKTADPSLLVKPD